MTGDARAAVLQRVRSALGNSGQDADIALAEWSAIPRTYDRAARLRMGEKLALLEDRLRDYDAEVLRVTEATVGGVIRHVLLDRGSPRMVVARGVPEAWVDGTNVTWDEGFGQGELDRFDGVLTAATLAIAETGSLVLQNVPGQGRRALSLVPDLHLCVVRTQDVVDNVPEAFALLQATATLPTTFISGPSATADIEMTRIKGVHGPRFLYVFLLSETF